MAHITRILVILLCFIFLRKSLAIITYNVVQLGAKPDGNTDSTLAFQSAWTSACGSNQPAIIYVPQGAFLLKQIYFVGPCTNGAILIRVDGTIVAPFDYTALGNSGNAWIRFRRVQGVSIQGGVLDGRGKSLWDCKASDQSCPIGTTSLSFYNSNNINISGLTSVDSEMFHMEIYGSQNVMLQNINISAPGDSPNTDGIHVSLSDSVTILNSNFSTGDDCVSIGPGSTNLWIENVACGPGHGISIGSIGQDPQEPGVHDVTVKTATISNAQNGVRIKTWGKPSNTFVRGVIFQDITIDNVKNPIIIDQNYCPNQKGCSGQSSGVKISNITYDDIHGTSADQIAVNFDCSPTNGCRDLMLQDINLIFSSQPANASCANASGKTSGTVNVPSCLKA